VDHRLSLDRLHDLARRDALLLLVVLDGGLIPFAPGLDEATLDDAVAHHLRALAEVGVQVVIVSGRPRAAIEPLRRLVPAAWWAAEHGAWRTAGAAWIGPDGDGEVGELAARLAALVEAVPRARLESKTLSVNVHWRGVGEDDRATLIPAVELAIDAWLDRHPDHERIAGADTVEVRPRTNHKGPVVAWLRAQRPDVPILAIGDDPADDDMFGALSVDDVAIATGRPPPGHVHLDLVVDGVAGVQRLIAWLGERRAGGDGAPAPVLDAARARPARPAPSSFLVVSNRLPALSADPRRREVGGLVAALEPALRARGGRWLGWSGQEGASIELTIDDQAMPARASFDFPPAWRRLFYGGLCNRSLWPLLHGFPTRVRYEDDEWTQYVEANATYARLAAELVDPDATIWIHDYHLLLVGAALRQGGHRGPIGLFLHVPFPGSDVFETLPWAGEILDAMLACDLVGFHTQRYAENFLAAVRDTFGVEHADGLVRRGGRITEVAPLPIGIDPAPFRPDPDRPRSAEVDGLQAALGHRKLLVGVDRLDYSKGIAERLVGFERLLERHPRWRRQVTMVQVSVPSRADVPEYVELRDRVENLVGRINGRFGDADWVPVRYLYRSYDQGVLAALYRAADVAVVTPLRDGMNLVAKEFVAAQDPAQPGVLVLSRFAGAAEALDEAVLTNPYHRDGLADDLDRALAMPLAERQRRHARLLDAVERSTAGAWADLFLGALARAHRTGNGTGTGAAAGASGSFTAIKLTAAR